VSDFDQEMYDLGSNIETIANKIDELVSNLDEKADKTALFSQLHSKVSYTDLEQAIG
jgi:hypothetical protein